VPAARDVIITADYLKEHRLRASRNAYVCGPARATAVAYTEALEATVDVQRHELGDAMENIATLVAAEMHHKRCCHELELEREHTAGLDARLKHLHRTTCTNSANISLPPPAYISLHNPPPVPTDNMRRLLSPPVPEKFTADDTYRAELPNQTTHLEWRFKPPMNSSCAKLTSRDFRPGALYGTSTPKDREEADAVAAHVRKSPIHHSVVFRGP